jgi:hypothetical protein
MSVFKSGRYGSNPASAPNQGGLAPVFFFVGGHGVPLLRNVDQLLLDKGIARLFGALFALSRLGAVLFCLG